MQLLLYILIGKLIALFVGVFYFRYLPVPYRWVLFGIALAILAESYGRYIALHMHQHNSWMFNFYMIIDFGLNSIVAIALTKGNTANKIFLAMMVVYCIGWTVEIMVNSIYVLANFTIVLGAILLSIMYFFVLFNSSIFANKHILKQPVFWLSLSTILYCAPSVPYWGLHNYLIAHAPRLSFQLMSINVMLDAIRYPIAAISFILLGRQNHAVVNAV